MFPPSSFHLLLDYQCNFECAHCSVGSSPRTKLPMPRELLRKALAEIAQIVPPEGLEELQGPWPRTIVTFTGGEATLRKEILLEGIELAHQAGFFTRLITNGWWATTPEGAAAMVAELAKAGLDIFQMSYDDYHAPFAPFEKVVNAVRAAVSASLRVHVLCIADDNAHYGADRIRKDLAAALGMTPAEMEPVVGVNQDYPAPTGTGESLTPLRLAPQSNIEIGCRDVMNSFSIHPNGLVKVCCGHAMFYSTDLTVGNLFDEPLSAMIERGSHNILYWWIHMYGPKRILDKLGVQGTYTSICHACHVLLNDPVNREKLIDYLRSHSNEVFVEDVLLGDRVKKSSEMFVRGRDEIVRRMEYEKQRQPESKSLPVVSEQAEPRARRS